MVAKLYLIYLLENLSHLAFLLLVIKFYNEVTFFIIDLIFLFHNLASLHYLHTFLFSLIPIMSLYILIFFHIYYLINSLIIINLLLIYHKEIN